MKFIILSIVLSLAFLAMAKAGAIEPVVEELQVDEDVTPTAAANEELLTNEDCHQPKETGRCFALFYRFAYDLERRECVEFIYGGCAGNSNNFESKEDCELKCMKKNEPMLESTTLVAEKDDAKNEAASKTAQSSESLLQAESDQTVVS